MPLKSHSPVDKTDEFKPVFQLLKKVSGYQPDNTDLLLALATLENPPMIDDDTDLLLALATLEKPPIIEDDTDLLLALSTLEKPPMIDDDTDLLLALSTLEKPPIIEDDTDILLALSTLEKPPIIEDDIDLLLALSTLDNNVFGNIIKENVITGEIKAYDWDEKKNEIIETIMKPASTNNPSTGIIV
jgi:hypothetical protein